MATGREKPASADLSAILEGLLEAGVEFILVGGLAAVVQGAPITTMDVDIVPKRSRDNLSRLLAFLKSVHAYHRRPDDRIIEPKRSDISHKGHALFSTQLGPLDVLSFIEEDSVYEDLIDHTVQLEFRGYHILVLELKKMIQLKKSSRDPGDRRRLPVLEETLRQLEKK